MEHANSTTTLRQQLQQQQQHQHQLQHRDQLQQEQQPSDDQQQFCLRWHNHQTSLLSTLPILLDQSHLTDVTLCAEGRTLRAHRVVLSACSSFFLELFRALDTTHHPVVIIPGASFAAIVALLTFMYSGEVNVYEEQIPVLLSLAETLGVKGLADVQNNLHKSAKKNATDFAEQQEQKSQRKLDTDTPPTPLSPPDYVSQQQQQQQQQQQHVSPSNMLPPALPSLPPPPPLAVAPPAAGAKLPTPLESLFLKSLQFYPNLLPQPLNFSQSALNKTSELLAKYQQHCNFYQSAFSGGVSPLQQQLDEVTAMSNEEAHNTKRLCTESNRRQQQQQQQQQQHTHQQQQKDKRIDKIVESLRCGNKATASDSYLTTIQHQHAQQQHQQQQHAQQQQQQQQQPLPAQHHSQLTHKSCVASFASNLSPNFSNKPPMYSTSTMQQQQQQQHQQQQQQQQQHQQLSPVTSRGFMSPEEQTKLQKQLEQFVVSSECGGGQKQEAGGGGMPCQPEKPTPASPQPKTPSNSKLYATCFICHKQLSNQYNLRVHLETHQNVRYACNVCSHVSRSKDALRKHVSYRHPGAPSPCETEARRKRAKTVNIAAATAAISTPPSPISAPTTPFQLGGNNCSVVGDEIATETMTSSTSITPITSLSSAFMFLPNQFHLSAAVASASASAALAASGQQSQSAASNNNNSSNSNSNSNDNNNNNTNNTTPAIITNTTTTTATTTTATTTASSLTATPTTATFINASVTPTAATTTTPTSTTDVNNFNSMPFLSSNIVAKSEQNVAESNDAAGVAGGPTRLSAP